VTIDPYLNHRTFKKPTWEVVDMPPLEPLAFMISIEWYWLALIGFITMLVGLYAVWKTEFQGPAAGIPGRMRDFAKKAIATAERDHHVKLDYSEASIQQIDQILETFSKRHQANPIPEKELSQIVLTWGGYVGTALIKQIGGSWQVNSSTAGANTYPIVYPKPSEKSSGKNASQAEAIPVIWCLKRIRHGAKESVAAKYRQGLEA